MSDERPLYYQRGFKDGAEAMREAAAKHIEGGRVTIDMQISPELIRDVDPAIVVELITTDAEAQTRSRIVQVIRALPLPTANPQQP